jgi:uncharacterized protein
MSELLSLFPLPGTVLFPNVFLPLHVFEPRYREMVAEALTGDRLIGLVLLRPGWERDYEGRPAVYPIGCSGVITHAERLADGRFNIVVRGLDRFRIVAEDESRCFRRAQIQTLDEPPVPATGRATLQALRRKLESIVARGDATSSEVRTAAAMGDEDLVNALAQYLELDPVEKQALLEHDGVLQRAASLVELLEMKRLMERTPGGDRNVAH